MLRGLAWSCRSADEVARVSWSAQTLRRISHKCQRAPGELRADRRVPDQFAAAPAHHGPRDRGTVTDIERHPVEGVMALVNGGETWNIEECNTSLCHSISDGGGEQ